MEFLPGGDLYSLLHNLGSLSESTAKHYVLQIIHALQYLRENGIIHRDLKPDNILISRTGHIKLTDFGLSFIGMVNRQLPTDSQIIESNSYVGTPDYVAPEIILARPHTFTCDLWSLGIIIYELLVGVPPFHALSEEETRQKIVSGRLHRPSDIKLSTEAWDLITKLLQFNPDNRIGANNFDEIINHSWFQHNRHKSKSRHVNNVENNAENNVDKNVDENVDIDEEESSDYEDDKPPFIPELNSDEDTDYFKCRYNFNEVDDIDIIDDIKFGEKMSNNNKDRTKNKELRDKFERVSVNSLAEQNIRLSESIRRRRSSSFATRVHTSRAPEVPSILPQSKKMDKTRKPTSLSKFTFPVPDFANVFTSKNMSAKASDFL